MRCFSVLAVAGVLSVATQAMGQLMAAHIYIPNVQSEEAIKPFLLNNMNDNLKKQDVLYGEDAAEGQSMDGEGHGITLLMTDALGVDREISIFAGLVRQIEDLVSTR